MVIGWSSIYQAVRLSTARKHKHLLPLHHLARGVKLSKQTHQATTPWTVTDWLTGWPGEMGDSYTQKKLLFLSTIYAPLYSLLLRDCISSNWLLSVSPTKTFVGGFVDPETTFKQNALRRMAFFLSSLSVGNQRSRRRLCVYNHVKWLLEI